MGAQVQRRDTRQTPRLDAKGHVLEDYDLLCAVRLPGLPGGVSKRLHPRLSSTPHTFSCQGTVNGFLSNFG